MAKNKEIRMIPKSFNVKGTNIKTNIKQLIINGKPKPNNKLDIENSQKVFNIYRHKFGIIKPKQIKQIQKRYHISKTDFAKILGIDTLTLAIYELDALPNKKDNQKLKKLYKHPEYISKLLENMVMSQLSQNGIQKLKPYLHI